MTCKTVGAAIAITIQKCTLLHVWSIILGLFCLLTETTEVFGAQNCICSSVCLHSKQKWKAHTLKLLLIIHKNLINAVSARLETGSLCSCGARWPSGSHHSWSTSELEPKMGIPFLPSPFSLHILTTSTAAAVTRIWSSLDEKNNHYFIQLYFCYFSSLKLSTLEPDDHPCWDMACWLNHPWLPAAQSLCEGIAWLQGWPVEEQVMWSPKRGARS